SKANYDVVKSGKETYYHFKNNQFTTMSIVDIYKTVQEIGKNEPKSLVELSFFSHGWMGGPILVNSFDDRQLHIPVVGRIPVPNGFRDPDDRDPRTALDFIPPNMSPAALK